LDHREKDADGSTDIDKPMVANSLIRDNLDPTQLHAEADKHGRCCPRMISKGEMNSEKGSRRKGEQVAAIAARSDFMSREIRSAQAFATVRFVEKHWIVL
jgi:hypothetical protein